MINKGMVLLDIVEKFPQTEAVFHRYDEHTGVCILCTHLFEKLETVATKYNFDLGKLLIELNRACLDEDQVR